MFLISSDFFGVVGWRLCFFSGDRTLKSICGRSRRGVIVLGTFGVRTGVLANAGRLFFLFASFFLQLLDLPKFFRVLSQLSQHQQMTLPPLIVASPQLQ